MTRLALPALLALALASPAPAQTPDDIRTAQALLAVLGQYDGTADGTLSAATAAALGAFQRAEGLPVTGLPDPATLAALVEAANAPPPAKGWERTYGGVGSDNLYALIPLPDGGVLAAGYKESRGAGGQDGWLLRLDAAGTIVWERTFGGTGTNALNALAPLPDGGILAVAFTESRGAGGGDGWLLRLDAAGTIVWERTFGGAKKDTLTALAPLPDGGVLAAGYTESRGAGGADGWLLRLDAAGGTIWERTFGGAKTDGLFALAPLPGGGIVAAGFTNSRGAGQRDGWLLRLDAAGGMIWERTFGGASWEWINAVATLPDGGILATGITGSQGAGSFDGWLLRLDAAGGLLRERTFGGAEGDALSALAPLPDGGVLAAGYTESRGAGGWDGWLLRLTAEDIAP